MDVAALMNQKDVFLHVAKHLFQSISTAIGLNLVIFQIKTLEMFRSVGNI